LRLQHQHPSIICVVDYHAITACTSPSNFAWRRREMRTSLASPNRSHVATPLSIQSTVPEHTELAWIFNAVAPLGELERQTQLKEK